MVLFRQTSPTKTSVFYGTRDIGPTTALAADISVLTTAKSRVHAKMNDLRPEKVVRYSVISVRNRIQCMQKQIK